MRLQPGRAAFLGIPVARIQLFFGRLMLEREGGSVRGSSGQLCLG